MGTDNLFHKRKAKKHKRKAPSKKSYDKVLIVCEDEVSSPEYFKGLIKHYKISSANVLVDGSCGSSPKCVFEYAKKLFKKEKSKNDPYDRVYCVIDKDTHTTYNETLSKIQTTDSFYVAYSVPCFEYWILLHFKNTEKPFSKRGNSSIANEVLKALKKEFPNYSKNNRNIFKETVGKLDTAITNAAMSLKNAENLQTDNPSTNIHLLIEYLKNIKKEQLYRS